MIIISWPSSATGAPGQVNHQQEIKNLVANWFLQFLHDICGQYNATAREVWKIVPFQRYFSRDQPKTLKSMFYTWFGSSYFHTLSTQNLEVAFFWERITFQGGGGMMPEECIFSFFFPFLPFAIMIYIV